MAVPPATPTSVPPGKYSCYTFDNGMLNYTYTDVQILDGSRYAVGSKSGTYSLANGGAMRFTGTMSKTGMPSVMQTISGISAAMASRIASAAPNGGT